MRRDYSLSLYSVKGTSSLLSTKSYFPPDTEQVPHSPVTLGGLGPATTADGRGLSRLRELICGGFQKSLAVYTVFKYLELALWERQ